ncbi:MAG: nucleotide sugar dehydrogenase [Candidatus Marinimicrobia bacterium]|nr:nucleotide sugar dehydrogenase [Candidatus Neomarinimicrobiota bacterium]
MKISIFGLGYVGCVGMGCMADMGHKIIGVDINEEKVAMINDGHATIEEKDIDQLIKSGRKNDQIEATTNPQKAVLNTEISFICVGTPNLPNGHLDLRAIKSVAQSIGSALKNKNEYHIVVIRSTVTPGTNKKVGEIIEQESGKINNKEFAIVSNPEFLREGSAVQDFFSPPYTLIASEDQKALKKMKKLYQDLEGEVLTSDVKIAEMMKLVNNSFHALKVAFANEIGRLCNKMDADSQQLMDIFSKDTILNISPYYLKPGFAYGGSCLPKDLKALNLLSHDNYVDNPILKSVDKSNNIHIQHAIDTITNLEKTKISFLSITFKPGTDDLRFSPALEVVEYLLGKGYDIKVYDKNLNISKLIGKNKTFLMNKLPHINDILVNSIDRAVEFGEAIILSNKEEYISNYLRENPVNDSKHIVDFVGIASQFNIKNYHKIF